MGESGDVTEIYQQDPEVCHDQQATSKNYTNKSRLLYPMAETLKYHKISKIKRDTVGYGGRESPFWLVPPPSSKIRRISRIFGGLPIPHLAGSMLRAYGDGPFHFLPSTIGSRENHKRHHSMAMEIRIPMNICYTYSGKKQKTYQDSRRFKEIQGDSAFHQISIHYFNTRFPIAKLDYTQRRAVNAIACFSSPGSSLSPICKSLIWAAEDPI